MGIIINLLVNALAVAITAYLLKDGVRIDGFMTAIVVSVVLSFVNTFVKPILSILSLPLTIMTLGLFSFIINGLIILLVSAIVPGFKVDNFFWAILFSLILSLVGTLLRVFTK